MATFAYRATFPDGRRARGTLSADTPRAARDQLRAQGLTIDAVHPVADRTPGPGLRGAIGPAALSSLRGGRRSREQVSRFLVDLQVLLGVGTAFVAALDVLTPEYPWLRPVLLDLRGRVSAGASVSDAMAAHPECFDELVCSMARAGERDGRLEDALARLNEYRGRAERFRNRLVDALLYPAIVLAMSVGVCLILMTTVLPSLLQTLVEAGRPLPTLTAWVKSASDLLVTRWAWLLAGALALVLATAWATRRPGVRRAIGRASLRAPVFGDLMRKQVAARLAATMSSLLSSGVPLVDAMRICRSPSLNAAFDEDLDRAARAIEAGRDLAAALGDSRAFPATLRHVFAIGQESGQLPQILARLADDYDRDAERDVGRMMALLQPALIGALAAFVGLIAMATILPIMEAGNVL
jgi:general secretion pathway protein F